MVAGPLFWGKVQLKGMPNIIVTSFGGSTDVWPALGLMGAQRFPFPALSFFLPLPLSPFSFEVLELGAAVAWPESNQFDMKQGLGKAELLS